MSIPDTSERFNLIEKEIAFIKSEMGLFLSTLFILSCFYLFIRFLCLSLQQRYNNVVMNATIDISYNQVLLLLQLNSAFLDKPSGRSATIGDACQSKKAERGSTEIKSFSLHKRYRLCAAL